MFGNKNQNKKRTVELRAGTTRVISSKKSAPNHHADSRLKHVAAKVLYIITVFVFFAAIIYILFFSRLLAVTQININGTIKLDPDAMKKTIVNDISGKYLKLVDRNNILFISTGKLGRDLADKFDLIENISVKKSFPNKIFISITERRPTFVLCGGSCYLIDENGNTFSKVDPNSQAIKQSDLPILTDDSKKTIGLHENVLDPGYMQFITDTRNQLEEELGIGVKAIHTPRIVSGDIRMTTTGGWTIYFDQSLGLQKETDMLKAVLSQEINRDKWNDLDYIDLRMDDKVYYKFKDANSNQQASSSQQAASNQGQSSA